MMRRTRHNLCCTARLNYRERRYDASNSLGGSHCARVWHWVRQTRVGCLVSGTEILWEKDRRPLVKLPQLLGDPEYEPRFSFLACLLLRSMTSCIVSICLAGMPCSTGSDLTGVLGGVGEGLRLKLLGKDTVRDLRLELREVKAGSVLGSVLEPWDK